MRPGDDTRTLQPQRARRWICRWLLLVALIPGCALDLPDPPNLGPLNEEYEHPSAHFGPAFIASMLVGYTREVRRIERTGDFNDVRELAAEFDQSVTVSAGGDEPRVRIDDVPVQTDALIHLYSTCQEDDESGSDDITAQAIARDSKLVPTIWGELRHCRVDRGFDFPTPKTVLWGQISVYIPELMSLEEPVYLVHYDLDRIEVAGEEVASMTGSVRYTEETIEFLITNPDGESVVAFFEPAPMVVGIRAANGRWQCDLRQRECEGPDSLDALFSF